MDDVKRLVEQADLPNIAASHTDVVKRGSELYARCLEHQPDNTPSCSIYHKGDKWRFKCFSCGWSGDAADWLMKAEGLDKKGAYERLGAGQWTPKKPIRQEAKPRPERICSKPPFGEELPKEKMALKFGDKRVEPEVAREFRDEDGELICYEARYPRGCDHDKPDDSPSRMWTWGQAGDEEPGWACRVYTAPDGLRPLYGLDRIGELPDGKLPQVIVCEGPKKADAGNGVLPQGFACVSWSGGAQAWRKHEWKPLAGRSVVIWPDADDVGVQAARSLADMLSDPGGLKCSVKVIDPYKTNDAAGS